PQTICSTRKGFASSSARRLVFAAAKANAPAPLVFKKLRLVMCQLFLFVFGCSLRDGFSATPNPCLITSHRAFKPSRFQLFDRVERELDGHRLQEEAHDSGVVGQ